MSIRVWVVTMLLGSHALLNNAGKLMMETVIMTTSFAIPAISALRLRKSEIAHGYQLRFGFTAAGRTLHALIFSCLIKRHKISILMTTLLTSKGKVRQRSPRYSSIFLSL